MFSTGAALLTLQRQGTVTRCRGNSMTVTLDSPPQCGNCKDGKGCGAGVFGSLFSGPASPIVVARSSNCEFGDRVALTIPSSVALKMAFSAYCLPVLCMLILAMICQYFISPDLVYIAVSGLLGLFAGLVGGLIAYSALSGSVHTGSGSIMLITRIES